jgi:hypothetical protein
VKRLLPVSLVNFLQANPNCTKADCFVIQLPTGTLLCATEGQWDITFKAGTPGWTGAQTTFRASQYGKWNRGRIVSEAGTKVASNTMALTCIPQPTTNYPGLALGLLNAAFHHLFDGASVWVFTAYMPIGGYGDVSAGIETKWFGTITKSPVIGRNTVQFECADPFFFLNMKVPTRIMQSDCPWAFCDANCNLPASHYTVNFAAAGPVDQRTLTPTTAFTQAAGYYTQGVVKCLTGLNNGLSTTVKSHTGGVLTMMVPWILPVSAGDTFAVIKGCDKTVGTCASTLQASGAPEMNDYRSRFGGTPFTPPPAAAI